jgi:hypothetical protein
VQLQILHFLIKKDAISKITLSQFTIERRTEYLSNSAQEMLKEKAANFQWVFLAMYKRTDVSDTVQLIIFVQGITMNSM